MYGNCTPSNTLRTKKKKQLKRLASCEQRLLERNPQRSLWYRVHHEATCSTNITMIITGTSVQTLSAEMLSLSSQRPLADRSNRAIMVIFLCCAEPYHANVDMMIPGSFHRRDTFRSRHHVNQDFCAIFSYPMRAAWCSSRNHAAQKQDEQLSASMHNSKH